jgi:hypothetical protein
MGAMTIAFAALTLLALALILVPRIQRARRGHVRRPRRAGRHGAVAMATAGAAPASTPWRRTTASRAAAPELDDEWDDDLGWGEQDAATEPTAGRVWSGEDGATTRGNATTHEAATSDEPRAPDEHGTRGNVTPHEPAALHEAVAGDARDDVLARDASGARGNAAPHESVARSNDAAHETAAPHQITARGNGATHPAVAPPDPQAPLEFEDDDWQFAPPPRRPAGVAATASAAGPGRAYTSAPVRRRRGPLGSPVFLLALYSTAGLALIVLAVNLLSGSLNGGPSAAEPAAVTQEPVATVHATATPAPEPTVSAAELERRRDAARAAMAAATAAVERSQRQARAAERRRIARERRARAKAKARARAAARRRAATPPATGTTPSPTPAPPAPTAPAPSSGGGSGGGGSSCEFCIG